MIEFTRLKVTNPVPDIVQGVWSLSCADQFESLKLIPDAYPEIVIPISGRIISIIGDQVFDLNKPALIGQLNKVVNVNLFPGSRFLSFKLHQWSLGDITGRQSKFLLNRIVSIDNFSPKLHDEFNFVKERILIGHDLKDVVSSCLLTFRQKIISSVSPFIKQDILEKIESVKNYDSFQSDNNIKYSKRYVEKKYAEYIGISPIQFQKVLKVKKASIDLAEKNYINLAQLSLNLGYYDLSHLYKDFKSIVSQSPKQYTSAKYPLHKNTSYLNQWDYS